MTPKRSSNNFDLVNDAGPASFPEPQTIPGGWDVSAFFGPEQSYPYRADMYGSTSVKASPSTFETSEDNF